MRSLRVDSLVATTGEIGTIEQPINLGAKADPSRIPLGPVVVESISGWGWHAIISVPRPCTHGELRMEKGIELNMNLASAFGIEALPSDSTNVPRAPVTIKIKDWPVPADSPRSEEHTSELQSQAHLVCRLLLEKKKNKTETEKRTYRVSR